MPDDIADPYIRLSDVDAIATAVAKMLGRGAKGNIEFGTVQTINDAPGQIPKVSVVLNGAPTNRPIFPTVMCDPSGLALGVRVAVQWDDPHQAYVAGILVEGDPPAIRMSLMCAPGSSIVSAFEDCGITNNWVVPSATTIVSFGASATFAFSGAIDLLVNGSIASTLPFVASTSESVGLSIVLAPGDLVCFDTNGSIASAAIEVNTGGISNSLFFSGCL